MTRLLCFGEIMLRLSPPGRELLLQSLKLDVWVAGAEANVATQLARLGRAVRFASRVPDNDLGRAAITTLRGHGVDVSGIAFGGERIGLYFVTSGAGMRATEVIYDRAHSAFAEAPAEAWNWDALLDGVDRLHLSGITPALGDGPAGAAIAAAEAASARGVAVSFDGNWRGKLWERSGGDPRATLPRIVRHADVLFGNPRDVALLLGHDDLLEPRAAAEAAFGAFPGLGLIASTTREVTHADRNRLAARIDTREGVATTDAVDLGGVVDRIGTGDAFAAGVLHALAQGADAETAAHNGLALAALKHSIPGDASLFRQSDIDAWLGGSFEVRR